MPEDYYYGVLGPYRTWAVWYRRLVPSPHIRAGSRRNPKKQGCRRLPPTRQTTSTRATHARRTEPPPSSAMQTPPTPASYVVRLSGALAALLGRADGAELPEDELLGRLTEWGLITYPSPLLGGLHGELAEVLAAEVLPRLDPTDLGRAGGERESGGRGVLRPAARGGERGGANPTQAQGVVRVRRAAGLGEGERLSVGREVVCARRFWRAPGSADMGAGARLRLGRDDVREKPPRAGTWRC